MSETEATLREKIIKFGTWLFLMFIFLIIVISFGMPDVIGTSSRLDAYHAETLARLAPHLAGADLAFLEKACQPL